MRAWIVFIVMGGVFLFSDPSRVQFGGVGLVIGAIAFAVIGLLSRGTEESLRVRAAETISDGSGGCITNVLNGGLWILLGLVAIVIFSS